MVLSTTGKISLADLEILKKNSPMPITVKEDPVINCIIETDDPNAITEFNLKRKP